MPGVEGTRETVARDEVRGVSMNVSVWGREVGGIWGFRGGYGKGLWLFL